MKYIHIAILFLIGFLPFGAHAATVYVTSQQTTASVGDTVVISVKINSENVPVNSVDGNISITSATDAVSVREFSLANSIFGLWPRTPSLSKDGKTISFTGGVPGGFNLPDATLFQIILEIKKEGSVTIAPQQTSVYINDGKATKANVVLKPITINVSKNATGQTKDEWKAVVENDKTAPEPFVIVLGQDPSVFSNKKFAFFSAIDNQSGIDFYSVKEGNAEPVRSGSMYVLANQDPQVPVQLSVTAYDKAGNIRTVVYEKEKIAFPWSIVLRIIAIIVATIVVVVFLLRLKKKQKNALGRI